jgi:hypothetical protein
MLAGKQSHLVEQPAGAAVVLAFWLLFLNLLAPEFHI